MLPNGLDAVIMLMATGQIGLYYVPVNWHLTEAEIAYILADCDAKTSWSPTRTAPRARGADDSARPGWPRGSPRTRPAGGSAGAVMWYTSGTTGFPKGVQRPLSGAEPEAIVPLYTWFLGEIVRPAARRRRAPGHLADVPLGAVRPHAVRAAPRATPW